jgi:hypothetical protein
LRGQALNASVASVLVDGAGLSSVLDGRPSISGAMGGRSHFQARGLASLDEGFVVAKRRGVEE